MRYMFAILLLAASTAFADPAQDAIDDMAAAEAAGKAVLRIQVPIVAYRRLAAAIATIQGNDGRNASISELEKHAKEYLIGQTRSVEDSKRAAEVAKQATPLAIP